MWTKLKSMRARVFVSRVVRRVSRGSALLLFCLLPVGGLVRAAGGPLDGDHRLLRSFVEDGAIVRKGWLEMTLLYDDAAGGRDLASAVTAAFRFGRDVEGGAVVGFIDRRREAGETLFGAPLADRVDAAGLSDAVVYGKYRILRSPIDLALGAAVSFPLASENSGLGPGAYRYRAFLGLRKAFSRATLVWSLGAGSGGDARVSGGAEERTSLRAGAGLLVALSRFWTLLAEGDYRGARYAGEEPDGRVLVGLDWRPTKGMLFRGGVGGGLTDGAPDRFAMVSAALLF
jgi:hypothetical protein